MTKLIVAFRNLGKKSLKLSSHLTENITTKHFHSQYQPVIINVYPQNAEFQISKQMRSSGSQNHYPSTNSVQKTICCNSTSNAPDDGRMRPKHVELRIYQ